MWVVWHDPPIVSNKTTNFISSTVVWSSIDRVPIASHYCLCLKFFRKALAAFPIFHARCIQFPSSAGPVDHTTHDNAEEAWLSFTVWPCRPDDGVDLFCCGGTEAGAKTKKEVHVWKAAFLKLDRINISKRGTKNSIFGKVVNEGRLIHIKDAGGEVRTISSRLPRK